MPVERIMDEFDRINAALPDDRLESWWARFDRAGLMRDASLLNQRSATPAGHRLAKCVDVGRQPPAYERLRRATAIAREPNEFLSNDALRYRRSMAEPLNRLADTYHDGWCRGSERGGVPDSPGAATRRARRSARGRTCSTHDDIRHDDDCT